MKWYVDKTVGCPKFCIFDGLEFYIFCVFNNKLLVLCFSENICYFNLVFLFDCYYIILGSASNHTLFTPVSHQINLMVCWCWISLDTNIWFSVSESYQEKHALYKWNKNPLHFWWVTFELWTLVNCLTI